MGIKKGMKLTNTPKDILYQIRVDAETDRKTKEVCKKKEFQDQNLSDKE